MKYDDETPEEKEGFSFTELAVVVSPGNSRTPPFAGLTEQTCIDIISTLDPSNDFDSGAAGILGYLLISLEAHKNGLTPDALIAQHEALSTTSH